MLVYRNILNYSAFRDSAKQLSKYSSSASSAIRDTKEIVSLGTWCSVFQFLAYIGVGVTAFFNKKSEH